MYNSRLIYLQYIDSKELEKDSKELNNVAEVEEKRD